MEGYICKKCDKEIEIERYEIHFNHNEWFEYGLCISCYDDFLNSDYEDIEYFISAKE